MANQPNINNSPNAQQLINIAKQGANQTVVLICNIPSNGEGGGGKITVLPVSGAAGNGVTLGNQIMSRVVATKPLDKSPTQRKMEKEHIKEKKAQERLAKELERKTREEERCLQRERKEAEKKKKMEEIAEKLALETERKTKEAEKKRKMFQGFYKSPAKVVPAVQKVPTLQTTHMLPRQPLTKEMINDFDMQLHKQTCVSDYLSSCKHVSRGCHGNKIDRPWYKLLQFSENHRPPYWGTWRRRSKGVWPRRPFGRDEVFDYSIDSDDEWEEPGESLSDSEMEDEPSCVAAADEEDDGFFVPHGYLSEDEGNLLSDEEMIGDNRERKQLAKAEAWEVEYSKKSRKLVPVLISSAAAFLTSEQRQLLERHAPTVLCPLPIMMSSAGHVTTAVANGNSVIERQASGHQNTRQPVPEMAMPDLIRHVHKSSTGLKRLVDTFRDYWSRGHASVAEQPSPMATISKRQLEMKITVIAAKDPCTRQWNVRREVLEQYNMTESNLSPKQCFNTNNGSSKSSPTILTTPTGLTPTGNSKQPKGVVVKSIKQFFGSSPSDTKNNLLTPSNNALSPPPPSKKRRISLEPVIVLTDNDDKENCTEKGAWQGETKVSLTPSKGAWQGETKVSLTPPKGGIDWQEKVRERNKISVSIDIHI